MNVKSPKKRVKSLKDRNQESLFLPPYLLGNSVPKHNIRAFNNVQPEVKLMSRMPSMIDEDDFNIHNNHSPYDLNLPDFNDYTGSDPFDLFPADLLDDLEENTPHENKIDEEPCLLDINEPITFPEDLFESSDSECDDITYPNIPGAEPNLEASEEVLEPSFESSSQSSETDSVNIQGATTNKENKTVKVKDKRTYAAKIEEIPNEAIAAHMLTPIFLEWTKSFKGNSLRYHGRYRQQVKLFIKFLLDKGIERPTTDNALEYIRDVVLKTNECISAKKFYKTVLCNFFTWANKLKKYDNIMKDITFTLCRDQNTGETFLQVSDKRTKKIHMQLPEAIQKLIDAAELRIKSLDDKFLKTNYKYEIISFVTFCNMKSIKKPEQKDLTIYCINSYRITKESLDILDDFFTWTESKHLYENLAKGIKNSHIPIRNSVFMGRPSRAESAKIQGTDTPIDFAVNAGFAYDKIQFLMQNDLLVFRNWLVTSPGSPEVQTHVLNFAHFLYSRHISTPTQQTLVDYYTLYLSKRCPSLASAYLAHIKRFFQWTNEQGLYPNITINIAWMFRKTLGNTDCPILNAYEKRKPIPPANRPLIVFH